ncbi:MAG: 50S ribosomal protein L25 [Lachnospiraceae bacterium]|uniref:50S ribosomal protein L25 n=1 Tax=Candidatus Weimeria bifida TaxID=2599074 RepID=A0A6N7IZD7_9FIRM|nr:50S ribosomal protein L25 [Candidatus Weimeria bifida]RRF95456.1 MAG: 50S ribosomal protein L25 [Lachnospiraceae bacterium]
MASLNAKTRDMSKKAKALRREGLITASMCGKDLPESLSLVIDANEATQFMKNHHVGSEATLVVDGKEYDTMIKSADKDHLNTHYLDMTFQHLLADEKVKGAAEIILLNEDRTNGFITRDVSTVEYKAYPKDIIDKIEIDVAKLPIGTEIKVADLDIAKNNDIEVTTPLDSSVLHIAEHQHMDAAAEAVLEADEAAEAEKAAETAK